MISRRLMGSAPVAENHLLVSLIRFWCESHTPRRSKTGGVMSPLGSKADIEALPPDVRFTPNSGHCSAQS